MIGDALTIDRRCFYSTARR